MSSFQPYPWRWGLRIAALCNCPAQGQSLPDGAWRDSHFQTGPQGQSLPDGSMSTVTSGHFWARPLGMVTSKGGSGWQRQLGTHLPAHLVARRILNLDLDKHHIFCFNLIFYVRIICHFLVVINFRHSMMTFFQTMPLKFCFVLLFIFGVLHFIVQLYLEILIWTIFLLLECIFTN